MGESDYCGGKLLRLQCRFCGADIGVIMVLV